MLERRFVPALVLLVGACASAPPTREEAKAPVVDASPVTPRSVWCPGVGMTDDPSTHRPALETSDAAVAAIVRARSDALGRCPGVVFVTATTEAAIDRRPRASNHGVILIGVTDAAFMPPINPLYLDGVRVFFTHGARIWVDGGRSDRG